MKEKTYQEEYEEFWKDIVENEDGTLNKDQVMRELSDYSMVMDNCAKAYYTMTNGRISKQNTMFFEVESIFNDLYTDTSIYYKDIAEKDKEIERLNNIINSLEQKINEELKIETSGEDFWCGYDACLKDFLQRLKELKQEN